MEIKDVLEMGRRLRNWGRWGPEDELGTLNFITPEKILQACRLVKKGKAFARAIPFDNRLDELAEDCAADGTYEFLLVAPPIPFTGAVGSPVNPIAAK